MMTSSSSQTRTLVGHGNTCAVIGCKNGDKLKKELLLKSCDLHNGRIRMYCGCPDPFRLFKFPSEKTEEERTKRLTWLSNIHRMDFKPWKSSVVCSEHFLDGKPTSNNPYPVLNLGHSERITTPRRRLVRQTYQSTLNRKRMTENEEVMSVPDESLSDPPPEDISSLTNGETTTGTAAAPYAIILLSLAVQASLPGSSRSSSHLHDHNYCKQKRTEDKGTQTEFSPSDFIDDDDKVLLYTGLPNMGFFIWITEFLASVNPCKKFQCLAVKDQILLVLMKLKLGLINEDLGYRFGIPARTVSSIFKFWIPLMSDKLGILMDYIPSSLVKKSMPFSIRKRYPMLRCIIDCFEVFTQRPLRLLVRGLMFSHYKGHQTIKFLIGVAPHGLITFLSKAFPGRTSDLQVTRSSGFLDKMEKNDQIMADRGFNIEEDLEKRGVKLAIPDFMKRRKQLPKYEVIRTRRVANVRIHVERAIRRIKTFRILSGHFPIRMLPMINDIVRVIACICNLKPLLIKNS